MKKTINICLTWHNLNSENYGVSALAITHIELILKAAKLQNLNVIVSTFGTPDTKTKDTRRQLEIKHGITITHIDLSPKKELKRLLTGKTTSLSSLKDFDVIIDLGEGDSFTDIYGMKRFILLCLTKIVPIFNKTPLIIAPQTIGPFKYKISQIITKQLLKKAFAVFSRDAKSAVVAKELGAQPIETTDVAFSLPYECKEKKPNNIGLNISALLWNGGYNEKNQFNLTLNYQETTQYIIEEFLKRGKTVHLIAHVISDSIPIENDYLVCEKIKDRYKNNNSVVLAPKFSSPIEAKSYIYQLDFFAGARMHATIGAVSAGVPTIPIAYSRKFIGVFGALGYNYTLDTYTLSESEFKEKFFDYFDNKVDEMSKRVDEAREIAKQQNTGYVTHLEKILLSISQHNQNSRT